MKRSTLLILSTPVLAVSVVSAQPAPETTAPPGSATPAISTARPLEHLTLEDKVHLYLHDTFSPTAVATTVFFGAIAPSHGASGNWGVGADSHGDRIQSAVAEHLLRHTFEFAGDVAFHIDSHYRKSDSNRFGPRLGHALSNTVMGYTDSGGRTISLPRIGSAYGEAFVSNLWYPQGHNGWNDAAVRGTAYLGWTACKNLAKEFWPDVERALHRSRPPSAKVSIPENQTH